MQRSSPVASTLRSRTTRRLSARGGNVVDLAAARRRRRGLTDPELQALILAAYEAARPADAPRWEELDSVTRRRLLAACARLARRAS